MEITNSLNRLLQDALTHFLAAPGTSSDLKGLLYVAQAYGRVYASLLKWAIDVRGLSVDDEYIECRNALAEMSKSVIEKIEEFPSICLRQLYEAEERAKNGENDIKINALLTLNLDDKVQQKFREETDKLRNKFARGLIS